MSSKREGMFRDTGEAGWGQVEKEVEERFKKEAVGNCVQYLRKAQEDPHGEMPFADL